MIHLYRHLHSIIGALSFSKRLLVWDAYRCHTSTAVRVETTCLHLHTAIVSGGCTKFIQAADVWNVCFKIHMPTYYDKRLAEPACHQYTNMTTISFPHLRMGEVMLGSSPCENSEGSFFSCAITTSKNGSDDDHIQYFKVRTAMCSWKELAQGRNSQTYSLELSRYSISLYRLLRL